MKRFLSLFLAILVSLSLTAFAGAEDAQPELRVLTEYQGIELNSDPAALAVEEVTGVHAVYESLPAEGALSKLNSILSARDQDVYDVMILPYDLFAATVGLGAYQPLNDLLAEGGQALLEGTEEALWANTTIDGQIMGIPYRLSNENYSSGLRVRTDLFESLGVEKMPETLDELTALLTAARDAGLVPLTSSGAIVDEIASAFGISNVWNITSDGIHGRPTTPGAKAYVEYMHSLFEAGLLDDEWAQNNASTSAEKFLQGKALMYRVYWWNAPAATTTLLENIPEATVAYLPPQKSSLGTSGMPVVRGANNVVVIPRVSTKAAEAIAWMNAKVATPETFRYLCIGVEGVDYEIVGEGEYAPILPAFNDDRSNAFAFLTGSITADYGTYWSQTRVRKNEQLYAEFVKMQENVSGATIYYDPTSFMAPNDEFTALAPSVNSFVEENLLEMIVGTRDLSEWDEFVSEYLDEGGEQLEVILNEWWDANREALESLVQK